MQKMNLETDSPEVATEAILACKKGGSIAFIGDYIGLCNFFPLGAVMEKSLHITGGQLYCQAYWKSLLEKIEKKQIDPTLLFSHSISLNEMPDAYKMFDQKEALKILIHPWGKTDQIPPMYSKEE
jgi:threonine dehydrogenase-like Zn-dependent dehydrogenase